MSGDTGAVEPQLHASGGHPGGYISHADEALGETWYFRAPDSVLRALSAAEHGTLSYSLKQSADVVGIFEDDVVIVGPAGRLSYRFPESPGTGWTPFSVKFTAGAGWRWNWNTPASQEQIHSVLANPTSLEIRGEYHTGPDEGALDTVVLRPAGEPASHRAFERDPTPAAGDRCMQEHAASGHVSTGVVPNRRGLWRQCGDELLGRWCVGARTTLCPMS